MNDEMIYEMDHIGTADVCGKRSMDRYKLTRLKRIAFAWVILKNVGLTFFKFMANRLDKGRFCSVSSCSRCNDNFISKEIPHYHCSGE